MTREDKTLLWCFIIMVALLVLGILSMPLKAEDVDELRKQKQERVIKPESLKTAFAFKCTPYLVFKEDTKELLGFKIKGFIKFFDKEDWEKDLKIYPQRRYPVHVDKMGHKTSLMDKDCRDWKMFILQKKLEGDKILHYEKH